MKGSTILVDGFCGRGRFLTGTVDGTPKPGQCGRIKATALVGGRPVWETNQAADGTPQLVAVFYEDSIQGRDYTSAYVSGTSCFLYAPAVAEEINVMMKDITGTGDDIAVGSLFMIDNAAGMLIANSSGTMVPFIALEALTDPVADTLIHCMRT